MQEILRLIEVRKLWELKHKARLELEQSAFLLGVPDETRTLGVDEVFCQIWPSNAPQPTVITGDCILYRSPAMHPGDVRRVRAVDSPRLRHLKNVIVFNVAGQRDLPNMLGGGDLDGDDYSLIWDKRLLFQANHEPMDYTAPPPRKVDRVTQEHICENFVYYEKNDILGQVANAHRELLA